MFAKLGNECKIAENAIVGLRYKGDCNETEIGNNAVIRENTIIYADVKIGNNFKTGHSVLIRERTNIGDEVLIGTNSIVEGKVEIGSFVKLESLVYIPTHTDIGSYVFIGPGAILTNDKYPLRLRDQYVPKGATIRDNVTIGANATVLPDVEIGEGAFIAAGSVVSKDVPEWSMAVGNPAEIKPLPEKLKEKNRAKSW